MAADLDTLREAALVDPRATVVLRGDELVAILDRVEAVERRLQSLIETNELWDGS